MNIGAFPASLQDRRGVWTTPSKDFGAFNRDQARGFNATPGPYNFGVCATTSGDPHCTVDPGTVPKAVDVLTPAGVVQSNELDYTLHNPVTITDVVIP